MRIASYHLGGVILAMGLQTGTLALECGGLRLVECH
jgi:hypothetical protein